MLSARIRSEFGSCLSPIVASYILPKFDELDIQSEDYLRARIGSTWGWVTEEGNLSDDKTEAAFGSRAEEGK